MRTYSTQIRVEEVHIDKGGHANWRSQLLMAEDVHFAFRKEIGLGLEELQEKHGLFLVMGIIESVRFRRQLRLGDTIDVHIVIETFSATALKFQCSFAANGSEKTATEMKWIMPLISIANGRSSRIPEWMRDIVTEPVPA